MAKRGIKLADLPPHVRVLAEIELRKQGQNAAGNEAGGVALPVLPPSGHTDTPKAKKRGKKRREMNRTEAEFTRYLQKQVADGVFASFEYEQITLRWGEGAGMMTYTPDFCAVWIMAKSGKYPCVRLIFFEVKGAHAWQKDIVKFKAARAHFKLFEFQLWEKGRDGWQNTI